MERRQVKIHVCIPHVVTQPHRHQRHDTTEEEDGLHTLWHWWCGILYLLREWPIWLSCVKRLVGEDAKFQHFKSDEARLLKIPWCFHEYCTEYCHAAIITVDELQSLQHHEVHQSGKGVGVIRERRLPRSLQILNECPVSVELVRVPLQTKFEVHLIDSLSNHLLVDGCLFNSPWQAPGGVGYQFARLRILVLSPRMLTSCASRKVRLPESLA
mmetsp:Transcript_46284/g.122847  ORF Transcript_46284/g.122847 Transcript_46284/m.122847 type:complete len:213 (-) Transcript_46284:1231-1869(-)